VIFALKMAQLNIGYMYVCQRSIKMEPRVWNTKDTLRLQDDEDSTIVKILTLPEITYVHQYYSKYTECVGECKLCDTKVRRRRVGIVKVKTSIAKTIWVCNFKTARIIEIISKDFNLSEWLFKVVRVGRKGDLNTMYAIVPHVNMSDYKKN
jgi:hypothetical protein